MFFFQVPFLVCFGFYRFVSGKVASCSCSMVIQGRAVLRVTEQGKSLKEKKRKKRRSFFFCCSLHAIHVVMDHFEKWIFFCCAAQQAGKGHAFLRVFV